MLSLVPSVTQTKSTSPINLANDSSSYDETASIATSGLRFSTLALAASTL